MMAFGPVPSRRLGRSLGINNIPPKLCSYSCVYCQVGRTLDIQVRREPFYTPQDILDSVRRKLEEAEKAKEPVDYVTFVPDGEPTLDRNLGQSIELLRSLGIKIAVITNASLIADDEVRKELKLAEWVSLKVDSAEEDIWRKTNRPHRSLKLDQLLEGMLLFRQEFAGELATETMLVNGINDGAANIAGIAVFLSRLNPDKVYLSIPIRPPAEKRAGSPPEETINRAYQQLSEKIGSVEHLIGYEGNAFSSTGNIGEDILSITAVHPMREDAVQAMLSRYGGDGSVIRELVESEQLLETEYNGRKFYMRRFPASRAPHVRRGRSR
jgi:wyosine [tRNA(Phe)-imidazoG37] synthetase (radical SAM superfamily)